MIRRLKRQLSVIVLCLMLLPAATLTCYGAGTVTDTITIKVGYWGIEQSDYVEKATYHWTELDDNVGGAMTTHEVAYSFYREGADHRFGTVIDSARGFYIEDLIEYAGVSLRDIQSISFYTADKDIGYFTSFTSSELFRTERYYFNNLAGYLTPVWKDETKEKMEDVLLDSRAWNDKKVVKPMLALEDSWATYDAGTENTGPNYTSMGTGNRFRLLFGQTSPQESRTNQTAKYVHTMYIALKGVPKVKQEKVELSQKVGAHTVTFNVSTGDAAMIQELIDRLKWSSSDESILKIKNISMQAANQYNDAITVTIDYETLKAGEAFLTGSYLGLSVEGGTVAMGEGGGTGDGNGDASGSGSGGDAAENGSGNAGSDKNKGDENGGGLKAYVLNDDIARLLAQVDESQYDQAEVNENRQELGLMPFIAVGAAGLMAAGAAAGYVEFIRKR